MQVVMPEKDKPTRGLVIKNLFKTITGYPAQWRAETPGGQTVGIRYRDGVLLVEVDSRTAYMAVIGHSYDGCMEEAEMLAHTEMIRG